jgi:hypothetical protein
VRATLEVIVASLWLGAAIFFSTAVAQAAFTVLPTRTLSGLFVGRTLPVIFDAGIVAGLIILVLQWGAAPLERSGWRIGSAALVVITCAVAQFAVGARIERVRASIPGAIEALPVSDARRVAFGQLHAVSVGLLGIAILAAALIVVLAARPVLVRNP